MRLASAVQPRHARLGTLSATTWRASTRTGSFATADGGAASQGGPKQPSSVRPLHRSGVRQKLFSDADGFVRAASMRAERYRRCRRQTERIVEEFSREGVAEAVRVTSCDTFDRVPLHSWQSRASCRDGLSRCCYKQTRTRLAAVVLDGATDLFSDATLQWVKDSGHFTAGAARGGHAGNPRLPPTIAFSAELTY
jgi:hypothetical protein